MNTTEDCVIEARCRAFSGEGVRQHRIAVAEDGAVRVWDHVARHFTTCHSLSIAAQGRLRRIAVTAYGSPSPQ